MLTQRTIIKKTKKGGVLKIVREHYLRDDIWCSIEGCDECNDENPVLEKLPSCVSKLVDGPHFILPDTNVILHQVQYYCSLKQLQLRISY